MDYISRSQRRAAAVLGCSAAALVIGHASASAAHAAPVPGTNVIVKNLATGHGQPVDGTQVTVSGQDRRVFANGRIGFALVSVRDELLPARTTDGGKIWRIDGPGLFAEGAADAALIVTNLGVEDVSTFYAYGGGQVVDITSDGGRVWRQAIFQGIAESVSPVPRGLAAYVDESNSTGSQGITIQFYTTNGGRSWRVIKGYNFSTSRDCGDVAGDLLLHEPPSARRAAHPRSWGHEYSKRGVFSFGRPSGVQSRMFQ